MLGLEELSAADQLTVRRARRLERFLTQPFFVTEMFTGHEGRRVPLASDGGGLRGHPGGELRRSRRGCPLHDRPDRGGEAVSLELEILAPIAWSSKAAVVSLQAADASGRFGIRTGHEDFLTVLVPCVVRYQPRRWPRAVRRGRWRRAPARSAAGSRSPPATR